MLRLSAEWAVRFLTTCYIKPVPCFTGASTIRQLYSFVSKRQNTIQIKLN